MLIYCLVEDVHSQLETCMWHAKLFKHIPRHAQNHWWAQRQDKTLLRAVCRPGVSNTRSNTKIQNVCDRAYGIQLGFLRASYCSFNIGHQLVLMGPKLELPWNQRFRSALDLPDADLLQWIELILVGTMSSPNHEKQRFWPPKNQVIWPKKALNM